MTETPAAAASAIGRKATHPFVYLVLYLPYGIGTGYVTVTLAWGTGANERQWKQPALRAVVRDPTQSTLAGEEATRG